MGRNSRAAGLFQVVVEADSQGATRLRWSKSESWRDWAKAVICCAAT